MADVTQVAAHSGLKRNFRDNTDGTYAEEHSSQLRAWDPTSLAFVKVIVDHSTGGLTTAGGAGGGGAATIADGADVAQGTTTDTSATSTVVGILKAIKASLAGSLTTTTSWSAAQHVIVDTAPSTTVTGPLTDTQLRASAVPVSGTVTASGPLTDTQLRASAVPVSGTVTASGPLTDTQLRASAVPVSGTVSTNATLAAETVKVIGTVNPPALTKGSQGANGWSVQDLKDSGRVNIMWTAEFAHAQTGETLLTLTESRDGAASTTASSKLVTNGKRLRITSIAMEVESLGSGTTPQRAYLRMRFNTAGAATTSSPLQGVYGVGVTTAIVKASEKQSWNFPDGIEFLGDGTKQIGFSLETPDWVTSTGTGRSKITITAFEY